MAIKNSDIQPIKFEKPDKIVGLDFETYFDTHYTLQKLSTTEYIRSKEFQIYGVGVEFDDGYQEWAYGENNVVDLIDDIDWSATGLLCHNTAFDGMILSHHFNAIPAYYYDSMSMGQGLYNGLTKMGLDALAKFLKYEGKVGKDVLNEIKGVRKPNKAIRSRLKEYCLQDVSAMWDIFNYMMGVEEFPNSELDLIHLTISMYADPVLEIDRDAVKKELVRANNEARGVFLKVGGLAGFDELSGTQEEIDEIRTIIRSRIEFPKLLRRAGIEPPMKLSPRTGKQTFAFAKNDLAFQKLEDSHNLNVVNLFHAKQNANSSIAVTRANQMLIHSENGKFPIGLKYCGAHTMRWSGTDKINPQNFPARGKHGNVLRRSIIAPKGYVIVVVDSSQIEARMLAWLAKEEYLLELFRTGGDPYAAMASKIYGRPITEDTDKAARDLGKIAVLGLGYGMGWMKFQHTIVSGAMGVKADIDDDFAKKIVKIYRAENKKIVQLWRLLDNILKQMYYGEGVFTLDCLTFYSDHVRVPNGLDLHYPHLERTREGMSYFNGKSRTKIYGGLFTENIIQNLARIAFGEQMIKIAERYRVVMTTHDETSYLARVEEADEALAFGIECLRKPPLWCPDMPFNAKGGYDTCYSK